MAFFFFFKTRGLINVMLLTRCHTGSFLHPYLWASLSLLNHKNQVTELLVCSIKKHFLLWDPLTFGSFTTLICAIHRLQVLCLFLCIRQVSFFLGGDVLMYSQIGFLGKYIDVKALIFPTSWHLCILPRLLGYFLDKHKFLWWEGQDPLIRQGSIWKVGTMFGISNKGYLIKVVGYLIVETPNKQIMRGWGNSEINIFRKLPSLEVREQNGRHDVTRT